MLICVPGASQKNITLESLHPNTQYTIQEIPNFLLAKLGPGLGPMGSGLGPMLGLGYSNATSDGNGSLNFVATTGFNVTVAVMVARS